MKRQLLQTTLRLGRHSGSRALQPQQIPLGSRNFTVLTRASSSLQPASIEAPRLHPVPLSSSFNQETRRNFETESSYHQVADEMLEDIQDAVEMALEDHSPTDEYEVEYASGVLTMTLPPHGTWVLNKQTPNRQIWWSSPLSGPRRYEFEDGEWVFTRDESHSMTLKDAMAQEFNEIYGIELELD